MVGEDRVIMSVKEVRRVPCDPPGDGEAAHAREGGVIR